MAYSGRRKRSVDDQKKKIARLKKETDDAYKAYIAKRDEYFFIKNNVMDCFETILQRHPYVLDNFDILQEVSAFRSLSKPYQDRIENMIVSKTIVPKMEQALFELSEIKDKVQNKQYIKTLDPISFMLEESIKIERSHVISDSEKKALLSAAIQEKYKIRLHDDHENASGFTLNVLNVIKIIYELYQYLRFQGQWNLQRINRFKESLKTQYQGTFACIDVRIDAIASFLHDVQYSVNLSQPFFTNIIYFIERKLREYCKRQGILQIPVDKFISEIVKDVHFKNMINSISDPILGYGYLPAGRRFDKIRTELDEVGISLEDPEKDPKTWSQEEWEEILKSLFKYFSLMFLLEFSEDERFLICPSRQQA